MLGWFQFGAHYYIDTFIDFLKLRPRRFLLFKEETPSLYMPPAQFGVVSLSLIFLLNLAAYSVTDYGMAVLGMVYLIGTLLIISFFYFLASRLWPIRGRPKFTQILDMQFYMIATTFPGAGLVTLIAPWWNVFHTIDGDLTDAGYALVGLLTTYYVLIWLFWICPYIGVLNGVSTVRAASGMALWIVVFCALPFLILGGVIYLVL